MVICFLVSLGVVSFLAEMQGASFKKNNSAGSGYLPKMLMDNKDFIKNLDDKDKQRLKQSFEKEIQSYGKEK